MFITFEGPEGSGKSSQIGRLQTFIEARGFQVVATREPGGTAIGDQIRDCLHDVNNKEMISVTEFLLYSASRAQLIREIIQPALNQGKIVLCDRFADSSIAYQGFGRGLDLNRLRQITEFATSGLKPDLTFLLDIDVERGLSRRVIGNDEMNRLDLEAVAFHKRVREGYHQLAQAEPERWCIIDADRSVELIQAELQSVFLSRI
ncbi:MAG: dTMP kinase [Candidatus Promineifilaceae bacterium]|nr:dTMP kinase [Candidatus Promineifilaceae bacterium]